MKRTLTALALLFLLAGTARGETLTLSFIGWLILAAIPGAILGAIFGMFTSNIVVLQIVSYIASFATSVVVAYITTAQMAFYDMLTGRIYGESYVPGRY